MFDTYIKSKNKAALEAYRSSFSLTIEPKPGRDASLDEEGLPIPAAGDPDYWYSGVRAIMPLPAFGEVEMATAAEVKDICGEFAGVP